MSISSFFSDEKDVTLDYIRSLMGSDPEVKIKEDGKSTEETDKTTFSKCDPKKFHFKPFEISSHVKIESKYMGKPFEKKEEKIKKKCLSLIQKEAKKKAKMLKKMYGCSRVIIVYNTIPHRSPVKNDGETTEFYTYSRLVVLGFGKGSRTPVPVVNISTSSLTTSDSPSKSPSK